jgi:hypothetical protein
MAPKKAPATKEIKVQEPETTEDTGKKVPPKRVRKPKEETTNKDVVLPSDINKLSIIKNKLIELTEQSELLNTQLEDINTERQKLCETLMKELELLELNTINKDNKNTFTLDKPSSSGNKTSNIKIDSDSSNDKESSDNDTNSENSDTKTKVTKVTKSKNNKSQSNIKPAPAKTSRAKPKITTVPVLQSDDSDSDE